MFISKKEFKELEDRVKHQDLQIRELSYMLVQLQDEITQLKQPKEPTYFK